MFYWEKLLNPKRIREKSSVVRANTDSRSPFKKDFDTICNSTILRRLQDKAQVFPLEEEDYARSRLTHSIEVLSIAESLGLKAKEIIRKSEKSGYISDNTDPQKTEETLRWIDNIPTILMSAALLHDMGNPPFGHLGEQIINDWFDENLQHFQYSQDVQKYTHCEHSPSSLKEILNGRLKDDLVHFDGNAQLLRLITKLNLVVDDSGMNLSFPVIATIIKYPCSSSNIDKSILSRKKAGYFMSEGTIFSDVMDTLGLFINDHYCRFPLAFLLEAADDIAYLTADIEDAHHKGIITISEINDCLKEYGRNDDLVKSVRKAIFEYQETAKKMKYPNVEDYVMHRLRVFIKGQMINAMSDSFEKAYDEIMHGECEKELLDQSAACTLAKCLRKIETSRIHYCSRIVENKTKAIVVLNKLLNLYVPAVLNYDEDRDLQKDTKENLIYLSFSDNYRYICERANQGCSDTTMVIYNKLRLVVDQISGMTDTRAMTEYRKLSAT